MVMKNAVGPGNGGERNEVLGCGDDDSLFFEFVECGAGPRIA